MTRLHVRTFCFLGLICNLRVYISNSFPGVAEDAVGAGTTPEEGSLGLRALNKLFFECYIIGRKEKEVVRLWMLLKSPDCTLLEQSQHYHLLYCHRETMKMSHMGVTVISP